MAEETIHESKESRSRRFIASYFRRLANAFRRGEPAPVDEEQTVTVDVPDELEFEVEVEREDDEVSLELEVEWPAEEGAVETAAAASKATFELYEDKAGNFRWRLVHDNGNIIADGSEGYEARRDAENGIESVKTNVPAAHVVDLSKDEEPIENGAGSAATFELYEDKASDFRWRLVHDNGNIIADGGQGYSSKQKAKQGLRSVKQNALGAAIEDAE